MTLSKALLPFFLLFSISAAHAQIGADMKELERKATRPAQVAPAPAVRPSDDPAPGRLPTLPPARGEDLISIEKLSRAGDSDLLYGSRSYREMMERLVAAPLSVTDLGLAAQAIQNDLVQAGYVVARVTIENVRDGGAVLYVDAGTVGQVGVYTLEESGRDVSPDERKAGRKPYDGYFSADQVRNRLRAATTGVPFNYNDLHQNLVRANSTPDLIIHTDLRLRTVPPEEPGLGNRRVLDVDLYVEDDLPLHGALEYRNTGTSSTEPERLTFTLQHLNLTRNDDVLTLSAPVSWPDTDVMRAFSASYMLPYQAGLGGGVALLGGWSELNSEDVIDTVDIDADGWFAGTRVFTRLVDNAAHSLNAGVGAIYRSTDEAVDYTTLEFRDTSDVQVVPVTLSLAYARNQADALRGRNTAVLLSTFNAGDALGVTDEKDVIAQQPGASTDYWVQRVELSRLQGLGGSFNPRTGGYDSEWYIHLSAEGQYAAEPLLSVEQMVMGGLDTVRGYPERDAYGDRGYLARLELRSPLIPQPLTSRLMGRERPDQIQGVAFCDAAGIERLKSGDVPAHTDDLLGVGLGLRLSLTTHAQAKLDYGWPLEETANSDDGGRFHFSLQGQF